MHGKKNMFINISCR
uniref:Uncharacterized protein n=1 Tax=Arundo donax TaxID=35708 RepID=A0A0A9B754_ARUDO